MIFFIVVKQLIVIAYLGFRVFGIILFFVYRKVLHFIILVKVKHVGKFPTYLLNIFLHHYLSPSSNSPRNFSSISDLFLLVDQCQ